MTLQSLARSTRSWELPVRGSPAGFLGVGEDEERHLTLGCVNLMLIGFLSDFVKEPLRV